MEIYVVKEGDTIDRIAALYGVSPLYLAWANQIEAPYRLAVGQALFVPDEGRSGGCAGDGLLRRPRRGIWMGGYAYPWIDSGVLSETCEYLTSISVFSYGFTEEGELIHPQEAGERRILEEAKRRGVMAELVLTPLGADGRFNNHLVSTLLGSLEVQQRVIRAVWQEVQQKGYGSVDVDFEYVLAEDRDRYVEFVRRLRTVMHVFGIRVTVALAPKTSGEQRGLLYEGMDYRGLGEAADSVLLMTYEWGYTYGPPMAVAPINQVRRVVQYAVTKIPPDKICLGVPNYGYDWPLPYVRGATKARTLGNVEAVQTAVFYGVPILFDETAKSPYFQYWQYGVKHEVWFEDVRSWQEKFRLVQEYGLKGFAVWQIMKLFRAGWVLSDSLF